MERSSFVFEISWEVCNMVGGIHTVIQSKAAKMRERFGDDYICVGPQIPHPITSSPVFREEIWNDDIYKIIQDFSSLGVTARMGRWLIPGEPKVLLVGFKDLFFQKDRILATYWENFGVNSLFGEYDYFEPVLFSHASALLIEQIYNRLLLGEGKKVLVHAHEWMTSIALLHLKANTPEIATVFTTHATILGRSLSSRDVEKPLSSYLLEKSASDWAHLVGIESKHSVEVISAKEADCFTTVSGTTSDECIQILGKKADLIVHNGLSDDVPSPHLLKPGVRRQMRERLLAIAEETTGFHYDPNNTLNVVISGRYEFRNKGIDLFLDSMLEIKSKLAEQSSKQKILAFIMCPAGHLQRAFSRSPDAISTHHLVDPEHDPVLEFLKSHHHTNTEDSPVHVIFLPLYLNSTDPTMPEMYWDLLSGMDLAVFPSWYEPWGYTPHEAVSLGIPTITTDCAGFGRWAEELGGDCSQTGVSVIARVSTNRNITYQEARNDLTSQIQKIITELSTQAKKYSDAALATAKKARWGDLIEGYMDAYAFAFERANLRVSTNPASRFQSFSQGNLVAPSPFTRARANVRHFSVAPQLPGIQKQIRAITNRTISWSWNPKVNHLLHHLDPKLWESVEEDPSQFMKNVDGEAIKKISENPELRQTFKETLKEFAKDPTTKDSFERGYFCMEYGITNNLRIYSGGLGILAGDHLKTASDMKVPIAAFGLFYQYGYFRQTLGPDGFQQANYERSELEHLKLKLVQDHSGGRLLLSIPFGEETLYFQVWRLDLNGVHLYLIDSNISENSISLRNLTDRLYNAEPGKRIGQEWLLSMGGIELIKSLELQIKVFHMNEGHTAFLVVGRTLELMQKHQLTFDEAFNYVRFTTIFTTHTPVAAGHDEFSLDEAKYLLKKRVTDPDLLNRFIQLGASLKSSGVENIFSMTGLAIRGSRTINAVSKIHEGVSQIMFNNLYPELSDEEVPVTHVTNGIHVPYWLEAPWQNLFFETLGADWPNRLRDKEFWRRLDDVPLERFYDVKRVLKKRLVHWIRMHLTKQIKRGVQHSEYADVLAHLDENTLIITHAKRMAPYKRADLLFQDPDRLKEILDRSPVPILFIYAGKAHPSDGHGAEILQRLSSLSKDPRFRGSVLILENYDLSFAKKLLSGSDIWLNTPLRPLEASGTSGMKAAMNGTLHFSIADGWWPEAYNGKNGWMIGNGSELWEPPLQNNFDRLRIYHLLENQILRDFIKPRNQKFSESWYRRVRESIASIVPIMSSDRMFQEYDQRLYQPAIHAAHVLEKADFLELKKLSKFRLTLTENWHRLEFSSVDATALGKGSIRPSHPTEIFIDLKHPGLNPIHLRVQAVISHRTTLSVSPKREVIELSCLAPSKEAEESRWLLRLENHLAGDYSLAFRAISNQYGKLDDAGFELKLVKWM